MKTLIAAVALAICLIAIPAFFQAAAAERPNEVSQYCVPQDDDSLTAQRIYCHGPG